MPNPIYRLTEASPPPAEPLTLDEMKTSLRVDHADDDMLIASLITTARQLCETATGRSLITRTNALYLDQWPCEDAAAGWWDGLREGAVVKAAQKSLILPKPPLVSVTEINVYGADDVPIEYSSSNYIVDTKGTPGRIVLKEGVAAPTPGRIANGIEIYYKAGYGARAQDVPAVLRQGMKQVVAHLYEHRGDSADQALTASGADAIFRPYRVMSLS